MQFFVNENSVVRKIWGKSDTVLFIFAGASAEFALNKAVDWLYYTGRLPADPLGRLFSTVGYARKIVFAPEQEAYKAIDTMRQIHTSVETNRGAPIPDWAYRDVLFMLIYYSIAAFELLERKLAEEEKEEVYQVFYRMGTRMRLNELPPTYNVWLPVREAHLSADLQRSEFSTDLFKQYKKHLGGFRYKLLTEAQLIVLPYTVKKLLLFRSYSWLTPLVPLYKFSKRFRMDRLIKYLLLPARYSAQVKELDVYKG
jgi:hypothetical protein